MPPKRSRRDEDPDFLPDEEFDNVSSDSDSDQSSLSKAERKRRRKAAEEEAKQAEDRRAKQAYHEKQKSKARRRKENEKKRKLENDLELEAEREADEKVIDDYKPIVQNEAALEEEKKAAAVIPNAVAAMLKRAGYVPSVVKEAVALVYSSPETLNNVEKANREYLIETARHVGLGHKLSYEEEDKLNVACGLAVKDAGLLPNICEVPRADKKDSEAVSSPFDSLLLSF
jgi:hypothetical protein